MATSDVVTLDECPVCAGTRFETLPTPGRWIGPEVFEPLRGRIGMMDCRECGLAFVESLAIYSLVVNLIILFANPFI